MAARVRSRWQQIKTHPVATVLIALLAVVIVLVVLSILGYIFNWGWTGLSQKTLWDWLQLLIISLVLAAGALLFNLATTRTEQKIALDKQREDFLQTYLDRMSELLLKEGLGSSAVKPEVRNVARVRTITILFQLLVFRLIWFTSHDL